MIVTAFLGLLHSPIWLKFKSPLHNYINNNNNRYKNKNKRNNKNNNNNKYILIYIFCMFTVGIFTWCHPFITISLLIVLFITVQYIIIYKTVRRDKQDLTTLVFLLSIPFVILGMVDV